MPLFGVLNAKSCFMKKEMKNAAIWHLALMKLTPGLKTGSDSWTSEYQRLVI